MSDRYDMDTAIMNNKIDESIADYSRRVQLAIDGFERSENVSTWVVKQHLIESQTILAEAQAKVERLKKGYTANGLQAWPCPGCEYRDGVFIKACGLHEQIALLRREVDANTRDYRAVRNELAQARAEIEQRKAELEGWKSRNVYPLEYREALDEIATLRTRLTEAQAEIERLGCNHESVADLLSERNLYKKLYEAYQEALEEAVAAENAAQAEIERLRTPTITHHDERTTTLYKTIEDLCAQLAEAREIIDAGTKLVGFTKSHEFPEELTPDFFELTELIDNLATRLAANREGK